MSAPPEGLHVHRRAGAGDRDPVVVFVHGAADRGAAFARVGRTLTDVDLVRYDRRGYGRSVPRLPLDGADVGAAILATQVGELVAVCDWALGNHDVGVPVVVCGHSHGALLALGAALVDQRVSGVVAWEPPMPWSPWWSSGRSSGRASGGDPAGDAMESFLRRMIGDDRWEALPAAVRAARRAEGPALLADLEAARAAGELAFEDVAVPVVLGVGGATSERHRRAVGELATLLAVVEVVDVAGADHGAHLTHPDEVAAAVRRCLSMVAQGAGTLRP